MIDKMMFSRVFSCAAVICMVCGLFAISASADNKETVSIGEFYAAPEIQVSSFEDIDEHFFNTDKNEKDFDESVIIDEKVAIHPEYEFDECDITGYFLEEGDILSDPYEDADAIGSFERYDEINIIGTNDFEFWEADVEGEICYVDNEIITTDKEEIESLKTEQEEQKREEEERAEQERIAAEAQLAAMQAMEAEALQSGQSYGYYTNGSPIDYSVGYSSPTFTQPESSSQSSQTVTQRSSVVDSSGLVGTNNVEKTFNYFVDLGYTKEAAAAICGNLMWESAGTSGTIKLNATESNGEGVGIVQWSYGRKSNFISYCNSCGVGWPNEELKVQLDFIQMELTGNGTTRQWTFPLYSGSKAWDSKYNQSFETFKNCTDIEYATGIFAAMYERCYYYNSYLDVRIQHAKNVLANYG